MVAIQKWPDNTVQFLQNSPPRDVVLFYWPACTDLQYGYYYTGFTVFVTEN